MKELITDKNVAKPLKASEKFNLIEAFCMSFEM